MKIFLKRLNANKLPIGLLFIVLSFFSFSEQATLSTEDIISRFFTTQQTVQQSKLYLHLDKPYYSAGDSIWFKGYLVNSTTHTASLPDNFIYVELLNRKDSIVFRGKIRKEEDVFTGNIAIDPLFPAGEYTLRAYTNWMRNGENDFFYYKNIRIANPIDAGIQSSVEYTHTETGESEAVVSFSDAEKTAYSDKQIKYTLYTHKGEKLKGKTVRTDENGYIRIPFKTEESLKQLYLVTEFAEDYLEYSRTFYVPDFSPDFSMTFFPEGGNLLLDTRQQIAFKCQQSNGYGAEVTGVVQNQLGDTIVAFATEQDGMGCISFYAQKGDQYYATARTEDGKEKRFDLPQANESGFSLATVQTSGKLHYQIKATPSMVWPDSMYLVVHTRGFLQFVVPVSEAAAEGAINLLDLPEGISHFVLSDKQGEAISERLVFIYPENVLSWQVKTDKPTYDRREKVSMSIQLNTLDGTPLNGDFSIAVTDNKSVIPDTLADNILSNLLLTSDLKGYIENPGYYFAQKNKKTVRGLDLIMMTHGWRRFDVKDFKQQDVKPSYFVEKGQFLCGRITNFFGKGAKNASIVAAAPKHELVKTIETTEKGEFVLDGIDYCDSTVFIIQARTKGGLAMVDIEVEEESIPETVNKNLFTDTLFRFNDDYLLFSSEKYYNEGGTRIYNLKEVVVRAKHSKESKEEAERVWADYSMTPTMLEQSVVRNGQDLLRNALPDVDMSTVSPLVVLDGMRCWDDNVILSTIYPEDMLTFDVYRDQSCCPYGSPGKTGPAVVITLKPEAMDRKKRGIILYQTLGYSQPSEFYHPVYDTPENKANELPDIRTTVYWNPKLSIGDSGVATVEFYTTDSPTSYNIEIEGITTEGKVCRYAGNMYAR